MIIHSLIAVIKMRMTKRVGHVARMVQMRNAFKVFIEDLKGRGHSEDLGVDGKIMLELIIGK